MFWYELSNLQKKQYIDAETVFLALRDAQKTAATVRGSMLWRTVGARSYLIRTHADNSQKSLGPRSDETQAIFDRFMARKKLVEERLAGLRKAAALHERLNRAHRLGRTPEIVVQILRELHKSRIDQHFLTVGTHALLAYESACGVRFVEEATTTQDIDLLLNTQSRLTLAATLEARRESLLETLQKVDRTFDLRDDQLYTAVNADGFEVDIIRHRASGDDTHPMKVTSAERDFWAVQVANGAQMASAERFSQMVVSPTGRMVLMTTLHPLVFSRLKEALSRSRTRDPLKRSRDALQASAVAELVEHYLPHLAGS